MRIAICSGEPSGDLLAAGLIEALKRYYPKAIFEGVAGEHMVAAGCKAIYPVSDLSVMGVAEVLPKIPHILRMQRSLIKHFLSNPPDIYIGVDAPDFNFPIEKKLKAAGIKTVHYVSPTVWAWRKNRIHGIKKAVDLMLCCFPFETAIYQKAGIPVAFVGHSAFQRLRNAPSQATVREQYHLDTHKPVVALLPGSRAMEIRYLAPLFMETARLLHTKYPDIQFILPVAKPSLREAILALNTDNRVQCVDGQAERVIQAADVVCVASGTATLETFVLKKPLVVAYCMHPFNAWLAKYLVKIEHCAIPNLLAGRAIVPELLQDAATPAALAAEVMRWLTDRNAVAQLQQTYATLRAPFENDASEQAAKAVIAIL
jgi:lipid-A-disaccharide synthase